MDIPPLEDEMTEEILQEMETYVSCHQNTVAQFIVTRPILNLCMEADRILGPMISKWWWK